MDRRTRIEYAQRLGAGVAASGAFCGSLHGLDFPHVGLLPMSDFAISLAIGAGTYFGLSLAVPRPQTMREQVAHIALAGGLRAEDVAETVETVENHTARIRQTVSDLEKGSIDPERAGRVRDKAENVVVWAERIIEGFETDPSDIRKSRPFLTSYLPKVLYVVDEYAKLSHKARHAEGDSEVFRKCEQMLNEFEDAFRKRYNRNLENETEDLDIHLDVFSRSLKTEV